MTVRLQERKNWIILLRGIWTRYRLIFIPWCKDFHIPEHRDGKVKYRSFIYLSIFFLKGLNTITLCFLLLQGMTSEEAEGTFLGKFTYDQDGEPIQTFTILVPYINICITLISYFTISGKKCNILEQHSY